MYGSYDDSRTAVFTRRKEEREDPLLPFPLSRQRTHPRHKLRNLHDMAMNATQPIAKDLYDVETGIQSGIVCQGACLIPLPSTVIRLI